MKYREISLIYFSPVGDTKKVLRKIAQGMGGDTEIKEYDLTPFDARWNKYSFSAADLVLIGMPSYAGRIPSNSLEIFRYLKGDNTPAVFVVTYGNEDFGDALLELKDRSEEKGFIGVAAAAFIGKHSLTNKAAAGRPDMGNEKRQMFFGQKIREKVARMSDISQALPFEVKGNYPYRKATEPDVSPDTNDRCTHCGICAGECPMCAINPSDPKEIDRYRCIRCLRCIHNCPQKAKSINRERFQQIIPAKIAGSIRSEFEIII